jgi:uncharacterized membrane protein
VKAYGALGVALVVLSFLEYTSITLMIIGFLLIALDAYTSHNFYKDVEVAKNALLTSVSLVWYFVADDEMNNEEE